METDPKVLAAVLRKAAENVDGGLDWCVGIEVLVNGDWIVPIGNDGEPWHVIIIRGDQYRLTPETITLKNGVTIPKPLSKLELEKMCPDNRVFSPESSTFKYSHIDVDDCISMGVAIIYKTKEEAIEASKALFE